MALPIKKQIDYALFLAAGQDDPHSVTITELCATIARLQERVETLRKELASEKISASAWADSARINLHRAEAAEAERDRLREALTRIADGGRGSISAAEKNHIAFAALQKEPQL